MEQVLLNLSAREAADDQLIEKALKRDHKVGSWRIQKRSVDARQRDIRVLLTVQVFAPGEDTTPRYEKPIFQDVHHAARQVVVVGSGPAGLFAALTLLEHGIRPIVIDRGKEVSARKVDIAHLNRNDGINGESNYCFGEGGAGTFSDGKLFSRSKKRGNMQRVMELFHYFGAPDSVLYEAHAHIGSDHLPTIIRRMREQIIASGGEVRFETKMVGVTRTGTKTLTLTLTKTLTKAEAKAQGATDAQRAKEMRIEAEAVILAIGHSAHDTYRMLAAQGIGLQPKGFAMGVRVEHPQTLIDDLMYHKSPLRKQGLLPAASYALVTQVQGRGVYSFCMCPGGHIVPAGSSPESGVVNGMSASHRNSPFANSGMVVEVATTTTLTLTLTKTLTKAEAKAQGATDARRATEMALANLEWVEKVERMSWEHGAKAAGKPQSAIAPAQRLKDFVEGKRSESLPACSYLPGCRSSRLDQWLPREVAQRLQQGFRDFDKKYPGFLTNDAVILGVESRSSSPVRIPRDPETLQHPDMPGLYPVGEGAGYAGGITSSALDGIRAAEAIASPTM